MAYYTTTQKETISTLLKEISKTFSPENYNDMGYVRRRVISLAPNLLECGIKDVVDYIMAGRN